MKNSPKNLLKVTAAVAALAAIGAAPAHADYLGGFGGSPQVRNAQGVAVGPDGRVYVTDNDNGDVDVFDSAGKFDRVFGSLSAPAGLAVGTGGVYVADYGANKVARYTRDGALLGKFGSKGTADGQFLGPLDVALQGDKPIVTSYGSAGVTNRFTRFNADGSYSPGNAHGGDGQNPGELSGVDAIGTDPNGRIYVSELGNDRIQKFNADFSFNRFWGSKGTGIGQFQYARGLAVDYDSYSVLVADAANNTVQRFSADGTYKENLPIAGVVKAAGDVAVDCRGTAYVMDSVTQRIEKFGSKAAVIDDNLLANPGFDQAGASCDSSVAAAGAGPGWTSTGSGTAVHYGAAGGFPSRSDGDTDQGGESFLAGGPTAPTSTLTQTIDVSKQALDIDDGRRLGKLQGLLGGFQAQDDAATVTATYLDTGGKTLGTLKIGPVTAADRGGQTGLLPRDASGTVPSGTRSIRVQAVLTRAANGGTYNDAYVDQLGLALIPQRPVTTPAKPGGGADTTAPKVAVRLIKRSASKVTLGVRCDETCDVQVGGSVLGKSLTPVGGPRQSGERSITLRLPKATAKSLKRTLRKRTVSLAVTVRAADAAGNTVNAKSTVTLSR